MVVNVLVTGSTGFVGSALIGRLVCDSNCRVRAAARRSINEHHARVEPIQIGNLAPDTDWQPALTGTNVVIHTAARVHVMRDQATDPMAEFRRVNLDGTLNLARQAAETGVKRFIYLSSVKVNGESTGFAGSAERRVPSAESPKTFREEDVPDPQDAYAMSKWEAEQGLMSIAKETGMEVVIIRPPLVYGPGVKANFLQIMEWLYKGIPLPLGAIHNRRSLVAVDNLVDLIVTCIDHPEAANQVFLASDGEDLSTTELLRRTAIALGKTARLVPVPQWILEYGLNILGKKALAQRLCGSLQVDISKAREILGWTPPVSVDEELRKTTEAYLQDK